MTSGDAYLSLLVRTALAQDQLPGYSEMLRVLTESIAGDACIVWRAAPGSDFESNPPRGHLFALAQWFKEKESWTTHDLTPASATGMAVREKVPEVINDIHNHQGVDPRDTFFTLTGMRKFCTVPILFTDTWGAVNVYRHADVDISETEFARVQHLAGFVPHLYKTIRDRASFRLMSDVNETLRTAEVEKTAPEETMRQVCDLVGITFRCLETSVFLENPHEKPGAYRNYYTTESSFVGSKTEYVLPEIGLTPWVLEHGKGVHIFDLRHFKKDLHRIRQHYSDIDWMDRQRVISLAEQGQLGRNPDTQRVPVSFMAAPIMIGPHVRGAIRCCLAVSPPYYFAQRELQLLEIVASRISQYWNHRLVLQESQSRARFWESLAEGVRRMNVYVHRELSEVCPDKHCIYNEALTIINAVIPEASGSAVRLQDPRTNELCDVAPGGNARRYPLAKPPSSAGAAVFHCGDAEIVTPGERDDYASEFGDSGSAVVSPIWSGPKPIGVLDIRSKTGRVFGVEVKSLAELWGRQLGLYDHLAGSISELKNAIDQQAQAYIDLEHQLKGPLITALRRVHEAVAATMREERPSIDLFALRGQLRKTYRVSNNVALFAALAKGQPPMISRRQLRKEDTVQSLVEYCMDFKMAARKRAVGFNVHREGFDVLDRYFVEADATLFEQAVNNVLDNAFKYSFSEESVHVYAGVVDNRWFYISVRDVGLPIGSDEAAQCRLKNWRGTDATLATGEGSGLGLYIVDEIMKAHGGSLEVRPTAREITEVRLRWKCQQ